ncbi:MAG: hypothetical protein OXT67_00680 [Zetaproteobacteria bacterium]|nr:hypothetical protein [Zetaproteobacteria bacterium]
MNASCTAAVAICGGALNQLHGDMRHDLNVNKKEIEEKAGQEVGATKLVKGLPGPKVKAQWGVSRYKHGGEMTGVEHVIYKHGANTTFKNSKYLPGTKARDIKSYTDEALQHGNVIPNGPNKFKIEYDTGKIIGKNVNGKPTSKIRILIRDEVIQTAFPY